MKPRVTRLYAQIGPLRFHHTTVGWQKANIQPFLGLKDNEPLEIADCLLLPHGNSGKSFGSSSEKSGEVRMERESHNLSKGNPRGLQEVKKWWECPLFAAGLQIALLVLADETSCFGQSLSSLVQLNRC